MSDNENYLLRSKPHSQSSGSLETAGLRNDTDETLVHDLPGNRAPEPDDNLISLTYVSSKGFFFQ